MNTRVRIYNREDMVSSYKNWYHELWDWSNCQEKEKMLEPNKLYCVKENYEEWESCGIAGDSEGERHEVLYFEEVPDEISKAIENIKSLRQIVSDYQAQVFDKN